MLTKKFYVPIGVLIVVIWAVFFFSLRSDVPTEPFKIYKFVEPHRIEWYIGEEKEPFKVYKGVEPLPKSTAEVSVRYSKALKAHEMETERLYANYASIQKRFDALVFNYDTQKFSEYFTGLTRAEQLALISEMKSIHAGAQQAFETYKRFRSQAPTPPEPPDAAGSVR